MKKDKYKLTGCKIQVKRSNAGLGLFAMEDIKKGTCIIEYIGRVISKEEEYKSNSLYLFEINSKKTIDGTDRKNIARYVNHSCRPNIEPEIWQERVFYMAKRNIKNEEELTFDYGKEYFDEHIKPKGCRCKKCKAK